MKKNKKTEAVLSNWVNMCTCHHDKSEALFEINSGLSTLLP